MNRNRWADQGSENFNLAEAISPAGESWTFEYTAGGTWRNADPIGYSWREGSITVHTPGGSWVRYSSANGVLAPGAAFANRDDEFLLRQRDSGGGGTTAGSWMLAYADLADAIEFPDPGMLTTVTGPSGYTATYLHKKLLGFADQDAVIHEIAVGPETTAVQWRWSVALGEAEPYTSSPNMFELPERVTTTRDGHTFHRDFTYADDSYNHFGQPTTIADFGDFSRSTTLAYRHFSGAHWLSDRVATETIDGTEFTSSWQYDGDTGFLLSQTVLGVTTTFAPGSAGNVATRTDANNHATTFDYDWGVPSAVHTPQYTAEYGINENGTIGWARQRGQTTSFEYDGLGRQTMAHELYGHVFLYLSGLSWTHVNPWVSAWISSVLAGAVQSITGSI